MCESRGVKQFVKDLAPVLQYSTAKKKPLKLASKPYPQVCDKWKQFSEKAEASFERLVRTTYIWKDFGKMTIGPKVIYI